MSDLKTTQINVRFDSDLTAQIKTYAENLGGDPPMFIRRCVKEICEMISDPERNELPEIVALLRYAQAYKRNPTVLKQPRKTA